MTKNLPIFASLILIACVPVEDSDALTYSPSEESGVASTEGDPETPDEPNLSDSGTESDNGDESPEDTDGSEDAGDGDASLCGNGFVEGDEECDLYSVPCDEVGYADGFAVCDSECNLDVSTCVPVGCGNGVIDPGEECEGPIPCAWLGFEGASTNDGYAPCDRCTLDTSVCLAACITGTEGCFCHADGFCDAGTDLTCIPHPEWPGQLPGTCTIAECSGIGQACKGNCCEGLVCDSAGGCQLANSGTP